MGFMLTSLMLLSTVIWKQVSSQPRRCLMRSLTMCQKRQDVNTLLLQEEEERYMEQRGSFESIVSLPAQ